jgi:hypothetical protein
MTQNFHVLSKITAEPPVIPPIEHASAHVLNAPRFERKYARAYLGNPDNRDAVALRRQFARGARQALEEQYWDVVERTIHNRPLEAKLGGDPSVANKIRAFLAVRYYRNGEWDQRIELIAGIPLYARLFFLVRTGHVEEALAEAVQHQAAVEHREASFVAHFKTWIESPERKLPKANRDHLQSTYNGHMLMYGNAQSRVDPFKIALYKLMGRLEPQRRTVEGVTATTEDWLWFQLAMVGAFPRPFSLMLTYFRSTRKKTVEFVLLPKSSWDTARDTLTVPVRKAPGEVSGLVFYSCVGSLKGCVKPLLYLRSALLTISTGCGRSLGTPRDRGRSCPPRHRSGVPRFASRAIQGRDERHDTP